MKTLQFIILLTILIGCATSSKSLTEAKARERLKSFDQESQNNINMLIDMIEEQSQVTDPGAKRYIPYEFNIPLDSVKKKEVHRIDRLITFTNRKDSYQCIGDNATKEKVFQIVALPYTFKLKFCPYE